jgi:drug/metabolite transporter (DMT)-like permease
MYLIRSAGSIQFISSSFPLLEKAEHSIPIDFWNRSTPMDRSFKTKGLLAVAIVSVSFAAIFIRLAGAPSVAIAVWRLIFSTLLISPFALGSRRVIAELRSLEGKEFLWLFLSGFFLSLHFLFWIASLSLTGVASSVVLVATTPLFVGLFSIFVIKERVPALFWAGLMLAICGGIVIGWQDITANGFRWKGDLLAVMGAVAAAGYFLVGSRMRKHLSLIAYVFPVYLFSATVLVAVAVISSTALFGYDGRTYMYCFLLALMCQIMGHTLFNWALKYVKATVVTFAVLGEPVGASILALVILREAPLLTEIIGGIFILTGLFIVIKYSNGRGWIGARGGISRAGSI